MVVVACEGVEGAHLMPPGAQLLVGVLVKAADISAHHLHSEYLEEEVAADREPQEIPCSHVVTSPMAHEMP